MAQTLRDLVELAIVVDPLFDQNCYVVRRRDTNNAIVIDPGLQHPRVLETLDRAGVACDRILLTHGHPDHVNGVPAVKAAHGCTAALHPDDQEQLLAVRRLPGVAGDLPDIVCEEQLHDGDVLDWHDLDIAVLHTPGHTRGSVCFLMGPDLVSGDTLFNRGVGRTDLPGGSWPDLMFSIEHRLYTLPPETTVYPRWPRP